VVNHTFNATSPPFCNEAHRSHVLFVKASHSTTFASWSPLCCDRKSPSGMCAKLRTVAASNNRVHMPWLLYYCLFAPDIYIVVLRTHPIRGESHIQRNATGMVAAIYYRSRGTLIRHWAHDSTFAQFWIHLEFTIHFQFTSKVRSSSATITFVQRLNHIERMYGAGMRLFSLAVSLADSVWAVSVTGHFGLAASVWGHFGHDISVHKQLITVVYWNDL